MTATLEIRPLADDDRPWLQDLITRLWGLPVVSISGRLDPNSLPGFIAEMDGERVGAVTYRLGDGECEVATLNSLRPGLGIGAALLAAARQVGEARGCRVWLMTTNENVNALGFYQRQGMDIRALHRDFVEEVRRWKPSVDASPGPIPFRHAIELSY